MNNEVKIREAVLNDLPILNQISIASKSYWKYPEEWITAWVKDLTITSSDFKNMQVNVAEINSNVVGFGAIKENGFEYEVMHLWILPEYTMRGIGKNLLISLMASMEKKLPIKVESDPNAYGFYTKMGFKQIGEIQSYPKDRYLPVLIKNQQ